MKDVQVDYFAILKDQTGRSSEKVSTKSATLRELYQELSDRYSFTLEPKLIQVAVNDEFAGLDQPVCSGDRIVFIPPVAGG